MTTLKLSPKELKALINAYILNAIDGESYNKEFNTDTEKLQFVADCFKSESNYHFNLKRYPNHQERFRQWIMGLPSTFNIDYENYRIIEIAKEWGALSINATDRQEDKIISNWFNYIAAKTIQLMGKHGITIYN